MKILISLMLLLISGISASAVNDEQLTNFKGANLKMRNFDMPSVHPQFNFKKSLPELQSAQQLDSSKYYNASKIWRPGEKTTYVFNDFDSVESSIAYHFLSGNWKEVMLEERYYNEQNLCETIIYKLRHDSEWMPDTRVLNHYNQMGLLDSSFTEVYVLGEWEPWQIEIFEYDNDKKLSRKFVFVYDGGSATQREKTDYFYNEEGKLSQSVTSAFAFSQWLETNKSEYHYNDYGQLESWSNYNFNVYYWENNFKFTYYYDDDNRLSESKFKSYALNDFIEISRTKYDYNDKYQVKERIEEYAFYNDWDLRSYDVHLYNEEGLMTGIDTYEESESGDFQHKHKKRIEYSLTGKPILVTSELYYNDNWSFQYKEETIYNAQDLEAELTVSFYRNGWAPGYRSVYEYNLEGKMIADTSYFWNESPFIPNWELNSLRIYDYNELGLKSRILFRHYSFDAQEFRDYWKDEYYYNSDLLLEQSEGFIKGDETEQWLPISKMYYIYDSENRIYGHVYSAIIIDNWEEKWRCKYSYDLEGNNTAITDEYSYAQFWYPSEQMQFIYLNPDNVVDNNEIGLVCSLSPNPAGQYSILRVISATQENINITINDIFGGVALNLDNLRPMDSVGNWLIPTSKLAQGRYFVRITDGKLHETLMLNVVR